MDRGLKGAVEDELLDEDGGREKGKAVAGGFGKVFVEVADEAGVGGGVSEVVVERAGGGVGALPEAEQVLRAVGGGAEQVEGVVRIVEPPEGRQFAYGCEDVEQVFAVAVGRVRADVEGVLVPRGGQTVTGAGEKRGVEEGVVFEEADEDAGKNPRDADLGEQVFAPFEERRGGAFVGERRGVLGTKIGVDGRSVGGTRTEISFELRKEGLEVFTQRDLVDHGNERRRETSTEKLCGWFAPRSF